MAFVSTRSKQHATDFRGAVLQGLAPDGGLYVPSDIPTYGVANKNESYTDAVIQTLLPYVSDFLGQEQLAKIVSETYAEFCPTLKQLKQNLYVLELFHGPTLAFKDFALQLLGRILPFLTQDKITILGATSGDTGSAAMHGCQHAKNAEIYILYPHEKPSDIQRRQMTTLGKNNVHAIAVTGSFDDCQAMVKQAFLNPELQKDHKFLAINSINWLRIIAQTAYYRWACNQFNNTNLNFIVPTGNFGNIYAGYIAKMMGSPIHTLHAATNQNDSLYQIVNHGIMRKTAVVDTCTPSMDIQIPSNFERYLFASCNNDPAAVKNIMDEFAANGSVRIPKLRPDITASHHNDAEILETIKTIYNAHGYICDPHTAVGLHAALSNVTNPDQPTIVLGCAHPAKFPDTIEKTIGIRPQLSEKLCNIESAQEEFTVIPADMTALKNVLNAP